MIAQISKIFTKIFGSRNDRLVKAYRRRVEQINALELEVRKLTDSQLRAKTEQFRTAIVGGQRTAGLLPEIMAVGREVMDRSVGIRQVFNPQRGFDPATLPADARRLYKQVQQRIDQLEPQAVPGGELVPPWMQVEIPVGLYESVRCLYEQSRPPFRARPFDVQIIGGMVLGEGRIAEMKTGEGKTIVAPLACYVACMDGLHCHVVTVNDYLVQRDRDWVFPFYYWLGLDVGAIHPMHMQSAQAKAEAYCCNVVYGTNAEFGFDYLRDNMKLSRQEQVQKHRDFCIIDEVDSILIDEARTPLIISGPAHDDSPRYTLADDTARHLIQKQRDWDAADQQAKQCQMRIKGLEGDIRNTRDKSKIPQMREQIKESQENLPDLEDVRDRHTQYYEVEMDKKASHLTHKGIAEAQKEAGIGSFYVGNNVDFPHLLENALRAHAVYKRDKDYVVDGGDVIIVDENTGRPMIGRQWSDGLHQAVEAKENVKVKEETQTLATVTIQNFFKLYKRLAGMTGTAVTEATEFNDIYQLEVVCLPTNVSVIRHDRNDLIFLNAKDKWNAILEEIKNVHDVGRPVLVGTTSVEKSEMLSEMLTQRTGIQHEVLNAKQHEREAHIIESAGNLGAVMIATNMAGRGTDIRLRPIDRADLIHHWQKRNLLPGAAKAEMSDQEILSLSVHHQAKMLFGLKDKDLVGEEEEQLHLRLLRHWVVNHAFVEAEKAGNLSVVQCMDLLDQVPEFLRHRLHIFSHAEEMGGLHIVGTERHEARRIDNQLRGRSGRQGDQGSSRFFISLEDDLMQMFAGPTTMKALSRLGMKEGDAIEHRWITRSVERAQRKVEERNFQIRKNLLEYDEVMEYQRQFFYGTRQEVIEDHGVEQIIFDYITETVRDAVEMYLAKSYVQDQIAEWSRQTLDVSIEAAKLRVDDLGQLGEQIRSEAVSEIRQTIEVTLGEYMWDDADREDWDLRGLSHWAMSRFSVNLPISQLRRMSTDQVKSKLTETAIAMIQRKELTGLDQYLAAHYGEEQLSKWIAQKFDLEVSAEQLAGIEASRPAERFVKVSDYLLEKAHAAYQRREVTYPVEFAMDMVLHVAQQDNEAAAEYLCQWAGRRFGLDWTPQNVASLPMSEIRQNLLDISEQWMRNGKLEAIVDEALQRHQGDLDELAKWAGERFGQSVSLEDLSDGQQVREVLIGKGRAMLRSELSQLERFVLLQILDQTWKDHLYSMDQLKDSIGLRSFGEKDPRIEYKREGGNLFSEMRRMVHERVTERIFRARLTPNFEARSVYRAQEAHHDEAESAMAAGRSQAAEQAARQGTEQQRADMQAADHAGGGESDQNLSRRQRRARAAGRQRSDSTKQMTHLPKPPQQFKQRKRKRR